MATMLNGAAVMDGALLLIAANESCPQPQVWRCSGSRCSNVTLHACVLHGIAQQRRQQQRVHRTARHVGVALPELVLCPQQHSWAMVSIIGSLQSCVGPNVSIEAAGTFIQAQPSGSGGTGFQTLL
jgi:hypothetical protein